MNCDGVAGVSMTRAHLLCKRKRVGWSKVGEGLDRDGIASGEDAKDKI